ncbi:MAG: aminotransferase class I/II-fold pyridoxal phosphate-dependent enzyme, partial [Cyclobacteriaceae bacterium]
MEKSIPYGRQDITNKDIEAVIAALKDDFLTQGPTIGEFENAFAKYVGSKYAVAVSNGTAALHLSALALDVKPGSKVITSPITFAASANCIKYCGGDVHFAEINPDTFLLSIQACKELIERNPPGTFHGIIPVDFAGLPVDLSAFRDLANEHGLWLLEDACHAPGGSYQTKDGSTSKCGSGEFADLAIFSFHPVKHIATGEGGMITTNREDLYQK